MGRISFHPPPLPAWRLMLAAAATGLSAGLISMALSPDQAVNAAGIWTVAAYGGGLIGSHLARGNNRTLLKGLTHTRKTLEELLTEVRQDQAGASHPPRHTRTNLMPAIGAIAALATMMLTIAAGMQLLLGSQHTVGPLLYSAAALSLIYLGTTILNSHSHLGALQTAIHAASKRPAGNPQETADRLEQAIRTVSARQKGALTVERTLSWGLKSVQGA